jgi:Ca2+-binding RTX toxin-like protein
MLDGRESFPERLGDTIRLDGLAPGDIELVWDWQAYQTPLYTLGTAAPYSFKVGPAAIRIIATGDTLHLGTLATATIGGETAMVLIGASTWDISLVFADGDGVGYEAFTVAADLFELGDGLRYGLMDLFALDAVASAPLDASWSAAEGLLARLGSEAGAIAATDDGGFLWGTDGSDDFFGGYRDDHFQSGAGDDHMRGGAGWDSFYGDLGDDEMNGGVGTDHLEYGAALSGVTVDLAAGTALGADFGSDRLISIESVSGGFGDDSLAGTAGADHLTGGEGDDLLDGRGGDDSYGYNPAWAEDGNLDAGDDVIRDAGGFDLLYLPWGIGAAEIALSLAPGGSYLMTFAGGGSITFEGAADPSKTVDEIQLGDGTVWDAVMLASLANPVVATLGTAGADLLAGADMRRNHIEGLAGDDVLEGRAAADLIEGGDGDDTLLGGLGRDSLHGGDGDDLLIGGVDADVMTGGAGADTFRIGFSDDENWMADDLIADFTPGLDRIDLSAIDGDLDAAGEQPLLFIGGAAFSGTAGEVRWEVRGGSVWVEVDVTGGGWGWLQFELAGLAAPLAGDFLL